MRYGILILGVLQAIGVLNTSRVEGQSRSASESILGVHVSEVKPALESHLDLNPGIGLIVEHVDPGSPADEYGLQKFDILTEFEDQMLVSPNQLGSLIREYPTGEDLRLVFIRQGKPEVLVVKLAARMQEVAKASENRSTVQVLRKRLLSISVQDSRGVVRVDHGPESRLVFIRDHHGQRVYEGPLETDEDFARVPDPFDASLELIRNLENKIAVEGDR